MSDRRLTLDGKIHEANASKAICVACSDARFSVGYTGVAEIDGQRTDYWIVDQVSGIFGSGHQDIGTVGRVLTDKLTNAVSRLRYKGRLVRLRDRGLKLVLAGFGGPHNQPFLAHITNIEPNAQDTFGVVSNFTSEIWTGARAFEDGSRDNFGLFISGTRAAFTAGDSFANELNKDVIRTTRQIRRIDLGSKPSSKTTAERLTWLVKRASRHPRYGKYIGRDCLSVVIHPNSPAMPTHYHPGKASTVEHGPHLVTPMLSMWDVEFDLDPQIPDLAAPVELPLRTSHRSTRGSAGERGSVDSDPARDTAAHYFAAYYQEARSQLAGTSFGVDSVPSHLMPWHKLVRTWETRDGYFVVEHISQPSDSSYQGNESIRSDHWEDYLHLYPRRDQTMGEMTGMEADEGVTLATEIRGKRIDDAGYDEVQRGDYLQRVDAIPKDKVSELTEEKARAAARSDMQPYIE